jgi:hypothetical protein
MPGGKRTDRISKRDLEVLEFIARFGIVPRSAVALWAGTARTVTITRESRLRKAGLVEHCAGISGESQLLRTTRLGLRMSGRCDLRLASFSLALIHHSSAVANLAASLECAGAQLLSERELLAHERAAGSRVFSAELGSGRHHRADLIRHLPGAEPPEAIEVELSAKAAPRLDRYLLAWARTVAEGRLSRVVYCCPPSTYSLLERAIERTCTQAAVAVRGL